VNCPSCNAPLFGATSCDCGWKRRDEALDVEISYREGLVAFWRLSWPTYLFVLIGSFSAGAAVGAKYGAEGVRLMMEPFTQTLLQLFFFAAGLLLFLSRLFLSRFRRFSLCLATDSGDERVLTPKRQIKVWFFLYWRILAASLLATLLMAPLNIVLSLFGISIASWSGTLATIFVIGPILMKFLIGHQFSDFRVEIRRLQEPLT